MSKKRAKAKLELASGWLEVRRCFDRLVVGLLNGGFEVEVKNIHL